MVRAGGDVDLGMNDVLCGVDVGMGGVCLVVNLVVRGPTVLGS